MFFWGGGVKLPLKSFSASSIGVVLLSHPLDHFLQVPLEWWCEVPSDSYSASSFGVMV